jgi:hypothetical protein
MYHKYKLEITGQPTPFQVGDNVKLRGDMGGFHMTVARIWNDWYCQCTDMSGRRRHVNMLWLEPRGER